jgi:hypothetical protein
MEFKYSGLYLFWGENMMLGKIMVLLNAFLELYSGETV